MSTEVKVKSISHQDADGVSNVPLTEEQVSFAAGILNLMKILAPEAANSPEVKAFEKAVLVQYGTAGLRSVQTHNSPDASPDDEPELPEENAKDLKVTDPGGFQGMSLPIERCPPERINRYLENQERQRAAKEQAEAKRIANWAMGGAKP